MRPDDNYLVVQGNDGVIKFINSIVIGDLNEKSLCI